MPSTLLELKNAPQPFEVSSIEGDIEIVARLKEMGFSPSQKLLFIGRAPFAGPLMVRSGSMVFALREEEAQCLKI